jgi:hypothetical protein
MVIVYVNIECYPSYSKYHEHLELSLQLSSIISMTKALVSSQKISDTAVLLLNSCNILHMIYHVALLVGRSFINVRGWGITVLYVTFLGV